jgi:TP901 family phage tail tape measure protein
MAGFDVGSIIAHLKLDTAGFQAGAKEAESSANAGGLSMGKLAAGVALGQAAFMAAQAAIGAVSSALKGTVDSAEEYGSTVMKLTRDTGLSTDNASKLAFAFHSVGIDADTASGLVVKFDKQIAAAANSSTHATAELTKLGVNVKDAQGNIKPFVDILGDTADKINAMGSQEEKVAEVTKLFGRSGEPMLKLLAQGKQGIEALTMEAQKYGLVLSTDNVAAVQKYIVAHREWDAAMEGIKIKIGMAVMPAITAFVNKLTEMASNPMVQRWAKEIADVMIRIVEVIQPLIGSLVFLNSGAKQAGEAMSIFKQIIDFVRNAFDFLRPSLEQLFNVIQTQLMPSINNLIKQLAPVLIPLLRDLAVVAGVAVVIALQTVINVLIVVINVVSSTINYIVSLIRWFIDLSNNIVGVFNGTPGALKRAMHDVQGILEAPFMGAFNTIKSLFGTIGRMWSDLGKQAHNAHIPGFATGIQNFVGGLALVGEHGPELINLPRGASVLPSNQIGQVSGSGGVHLQIQGDLNIGGDYDTDSFMKRIQRNLELQKQGGSAI